MPLFFYFSFNGSFFSSSSSSLASLFPSQCKPLLTINFPFHVMPEPPKKSLSHFKSKIKNTHRRIKGFYCGKLHLFTSQHPGADSSQHLWIFNLQVCKNGWLLITRDESYWNHKKGWAKNVTLRINKVEHSAVKIVWINFTSLFYKSVCLIECAPKKTIGEVSWLRRGSF